MELPKTLHGKLFLLAYDRRRKRLDGDRHWRFGLALRTAMLTDLFLSGHLEDHEGGPRRVAISPPPEDPVLAAALAEIGEVENRVWAVAIAPGSQEEAPRVVRSQLEDNGWVKTQRRRTLGVVTADRLHLSDEDTVSRLADRVAVAMRNAIADKPCDSRARALGLIGALGQLPTVFTFEGTERDRDALEYLLCNDAPPIRGMREVVHRVGGQMEAHRRFFGEGG
jgi:hypothetical protein